MQSEERHSRIEPLIGCRLISVEQRDHSWCFGFSGDSVIVTESAWRLIVDGRIAVSSEDHGHPFGRPEPVDAASSAQWVVGQKVEAASISECTGDLTVEFSGKTQLQLLQVSSGYESWRLRTSGGETICTGGGTLVHSPRG